MKILDLVQGSEEWLAARQQYLCASEAAPMMAASRNMKRNELLRLKATGQGKEFSDYVQKRILNAGHAAEAAIRPHVEKIIGDDLFPAVGVDGELLASFDGITMDEETIFEHKLWNEELAETVRARNLGPEYYWQLEHQLLVSGAKRVIFVVSDSTPENCEHMIYTAVPGRAKQLMDGWAQFKVDVANWQPEAPVPIVEKTEIASLPVLSVVLVGEVRASNLVVYREKALDFIRNIKTDLQTDQDFADAESTVKFCEKAEDELARVKASALNQTESIAELFNTVDKLSAEMRNKRLMLDKLVKTRKEAIKDEILQKARAAFAKHVSDINARLGKARLPEITPNFILAMKGKKTLSTLRSAVDDELARAKVEANVTGQHIERCLAHLAVQGEELAFLFPDTQSLVLKKFDELKDVVTNRIAAHREKERVRQEAERERIRQEERSRAEGIERERLQREAQEFIALIDAQPKAVLPSHPAPSPLPPPPAAPSSRKTTASKSPAKPIRPSDSEIVGTLAMFYKVADTTVIEWLSQFDAQTLSKRAA